MTIGRWTAAAAAAMIFAAGAGAAYLLRGHSSEPRRDSAVRPPTTSGDATPPPPGVVRLPPELAARAGITTGRASAAAVAGVVRVPASVQPNAYKQVSVTPLASGRVTRVRVELGQRVARGAAIADVYSPEAAQARAVYLSAKADTDAAEARLRRTERLAALGSASQQELEQMRAEHVRAETETRQASARLTLLGIDPSRSSDAHAEAASTVTVVSPQPGVVLQRPATVGMTVEPSTVLATIAELSPVWVVADVYEQDFAAVAVGASASVTAAAYPSAQWSGRVTYIAPEVRPETRTAQLRIEIPNTDGRLKFGMFVTAEIESRGTTAVTIPAAAVQSIGADTVVFVPDGAAGAFRERPITLGRPTGDRVVVLEGLAAGEPLVTKGSFELRAEAERQGVRTAATQAASIAVTAAGFEPASLTLQRGVPARLTFTRTTDQTCATEVAIPGLGIRRALPLHQPVTIEFVPAGPTTTFQCGMNMLTGTLIIH